MALECLGFFDGMSNYCNDLFFRLRGPREPDGRIVIAAIDDQTLNRLGRWPLSRIYYAKLLDRFDGNGVVGFDIILDDPSGDDPFLCKAIRKHGHVVLSSHIERFGPSTPLICLPDSQRVGHVHLEPDIDGIVRRVSHTIYAGNLKIPSFTSALYEDWKGSSIPRQNPSPFDNVRKLPGGIMQMDFKNINFFGPPGSFKRLSFIDVFNGRYPASFFKNKIILVGLTAEGLDGEILTPFTDSRNRMNGVEVHANILNNLIDKNSITETSLLIKVIISIALSIFGLFLFIIAPGRIMVLQWLAGVALAAFLSFSLFAGFDIWFSPVLFTITFSLMFVAAFVFKLEQAWRDLAEEKDQWEESFNAINDAIVLMDSKCKIARMNESAKTMLEPSMLDFLISRCKSMLSIDSSFTGESDSLPCTTEETNSTGERHFEIKSLYSFDRKEKQKGVVHVVRDITLSKKAEKEKELLQFQLLQSQKMESIGRLAGGIAHDFNNILTVILGCCEFALRKLSQDAPLRKQVLAIQDSGQKAASLTRQLLVFSRKQEIELQVVRVNQIVENMAGILERIIGEDVTLHLKTEKPVQSVMADPGQLEQVIMNLSVNARDAMPSGGTLTIETDEEVLDEFYTRHHTGVDSGKYAVLTVSDTGIGMPPEVRERIFEPFFTTKKPGKGTGLGMSTVFGIIKQMSGHIYVYSEVDIGSVFKIYIPTCRQHPEGRPEPQSIILPQGTESVLVAEDDPAIRQLVIDSLAPQGFKVTVACSGAEAMELVESISSSFDILLTDVVMPEMGGKELAQNFQKKFPNAAVLFMSGYTDEMILQQGLEKQGISFIQKPCTPSKLVIKLREVLDSRHLTVGIID